MRMSEVLAADPVLDPTASIRALSVDALVQVERDQAVVDARRARILATICARPLPDADGTPAPEKEWARDEVACVLRLSCGTAAQLMHDAADLVTRFPTTLALVDRG